jgi:catechol 2,3-dioxygenase-like lactoylglutathione lyase family enzyme
MIDHLSLAVSDIEVARRLYDRCLAPLGLVRLMGTDEPDYVATGYGSKDVPEPCFWIGAGRQPARLSPLREGQHVAFRAPSRAAVDAWHAAALEAGAADNGKPGLRPDYHADYYAAFAIDPDGNRIEAVCHLPG